MKKDNSPKKSKTSKTSKEQNFVVPITPGTTITISNSAQAKQPTATPVASPTTIVGTTAYQNFINPLIGSIIIGVTYYVIYLNRYTENFLGDISEFSWAFLFIGLIVFCIAVVNGIKLIFSLFKKIPSKPLFYIPLLLVIFISLVAAFFAGKDFLFKGAFFNSVMSGIHSTLGNINVVVPSTDGGKWNGIYSLDLALGKCTGSAASQVDINSIIKQAIAGKVGGLEVYNSRIMIYRDGFIDANGQAKSTYSKSGANILLTYNFKDNNGALSYSGTYRMWDLNPYVEFDCNGGISGVKR